jgi:hypothetical protein
VAKSILLRRPKNSETYNAAASTQVGIPRKQLSSIIQDLIDISGNQADKVVERLVSENKLIQVPRAAFETDDTLILNNSLQAYAYHHFCLSNTV